MGLATEMNALGEPAPTLVPFYNVTFFWVASINTKDIPCPD